MKQIFEVSNFPWDENGFRPKTVAELSWDENGYYVHMKTDEKNLRTEVKKNNTSVCQDSCMEAFFCFSPQKSNRYFNIEVNPISTVHFAVGEDRYNRTLLSEDDIESLKCHSQKTDDGWETEFFIPLSLIEREFPGYKHKSGTEIKANFYKCGDKTEHEHYGCWNNIVKEKPDFHCPEFFGKIVLE